MDLTRARAEVHTLKQQVTSVTQQLELQQLQGVVQRSSEVAGANGLVEGLAARLAAAQVMRREAEEKEAESARKLAAAERRLGELQQQQKGAHDDEQMQEAQKSKQVCLAA